MSTVRGDCADNTITVLIVEGQEVIRRGLLAMTSSMPGIRASAVPAVYHPEDDPVVGNADVTLVSTVALKALERADYPVEQLRPMLVLMAALQPRELEVATRRTANGYLIQTELSAGTLRAAVLQVAEGQLVVPSAVAAYLLNRVRGRENAVLPRLQQLSPRESEVLDLLVAGAGNKEIATKLGLSIHGVKRHVSTLLNQFHSPSRVHLVSHVLRSGLLVGADPE